MSNENNQQSANIISQKIIFFTLVFILPILPFILYLVIQEFTETRIYTNPGYMPFWDSHYWLFKLMEYGGSILITLFLAMFLICDLRKSYKNSSDQNKFKTRKFIQNIILLIIILDGVFELYSLYAFFNAGSDIGNIFGALILVAIGLIIEIPSLIVFFILRNKTMKDYPKI